jgi:ankyrin repeat protein
MGKLLCHGLVLLTFIKGCDGCRKLPIEKGKSLFEAQLVVEDPQIFIHQQARLTLTITSSIQENQDAGYTIQALSVEQGRLFLSPGNELQVGSKLRLGKQSLHFEPLMDISFGKQKTLSAPIQLTLGHDKGKDVNVSASIDLKPIHCNVQACVKEPSMREQKQLKGDISLIEILLTDVAEDLTEQSWQLTAWSCSDGIARALFNEQLQELTRFPLKVKQPNKLFLRIPDLDIGQPPTLTLQVEGPGQSSYKTVVQLSFAQRLAITNKIKQLVKTTRQENQELEPHLEKPDEEWGYDEIKALIKETKKKIATIEEELGLIQDSPTMREGSLPEKIQTKFKTLLETDVPALKKKNEVLKAKLEQKEKACFSASLQPSNLSMFSHQQAIITLELISTIPEARKASYTVKRIDLGAGQLRFEKSREPVKVGSKVSFGPQTLVFEPSCSVVDWQLVDIKLTLANDKGSSYLVSTAIEVNPIQFKVIAELQEPSQAERTRVPEGSWVVGLQVTAVPEGLASDSWKLVGWEGSEGVTATLMNEKLETLATFPLLGEKKHRFYLQVATLTLDQAAWLNLAVEGPGKTTQKVKLSLLPVQQISISSKIASLFQDVRQHQEKIENYLSKPLKEREYDELHTLIKETEEKIVHYKGIFTLLEDNYMVKEGLTTDKAKATLATIKDQLLPGLAEKKKQLYAEAVDWKEVLSEIGEGALGSYTNQPDPSGRYLIHHCLDKPDVAIKALPFIIARTRDLNVKDGQGRTPLHQAIDNRIEKDHSMYALNLLLQQGADPNIPLPDGEPVLIRCLRMKKAYCGDVDQTIRPSHERRINPDSKKKENTSLEEEVQLGKEVQEIVYSLLGAKANPNTSYPKTGETPLLYVIRNYETYKQDVAYQLMNLFLDHGADPNQRFKNGEGPTPLMWIINYHNDKNDQNLVKKIERLLKSGAKPNLAMEKGDFSMCKKDIKGWTPLHAAIERKNLELIKVLLQNGADKNATAIVSVANDSRTRSIPAKYLAWLLVCREDKRDRYPFSLDWMFIRNPVNLLKGDYKFLADTPDWAGKSDDLPMIPGAITVETFRAIQACISCYGNNA